jgi:hypothetical protein
MTWKKTALILSGGAQGAFQCGAEKYAREVKVTIGISWLAFLLRSTLYAIHG